MKQFRTPYIFRWIFHRRLWGFSLKSKKVYLTFDDGPTPECTEWILNFLQSKKVKATFFCVGSNAQQHPDLMQSIKENGHQIGNHTMHHEKGTSVSKQEYLKSIEEASKHIQSKLFRPPYGRIPMFYTKAIRKEYQIIMWTWLSYDYDSSVSIDTIIEQSKRIRGGDILVVHDNKKSFERLQEILPTLVDVVRQKGFEFEVISA